MEDFIYIIVFLSGEKQVSREYFSENDSVERSNHRYIYGKSFDTPNEYAEHVLDDGENIYTSAMISKIKYIEYGMRDCPAWCYYVSCLPDCAPPYGYDQRELLDYAESGIIEQFEIYR